jgi:puromycin-sensitive aminopeptidase
MVRLNLNALKVALVTILALALGPVASARAAGDQSAQNKRLPGDVIPSSYTLYFDPKPEGKSFEGEERIEVQVRNATRKIVLNAVDIHIAEAEFKSSRASVSKKLSIRYDSKLQEVILESSEPLAAGLYSLSLKFAGKLNDELKGFFREKVVDPQGNTAWLCATQMEPTDARRMFPCFDEPAYKATFSISTSLNADESAVSNSPIVNEVTDSEKRRKVVTFDTTPKMSTYLVALVIGQITPSEPITSAGVPIRVWCVKGKEQMTGYSRAFAAKVMDYYTKYFHLPYCAKKLDLIAIPDFPMVPWKTWVPACFEKIYF